jgi:hypothetical protein
MLNKTVNIAELPKHERDAIERKRVDSLVRYYFNQLNYASFKEMANTKLSKEYLDYKNKEGKTRLELINAKALSVYGNSVFDLQNKES